MRKIGPAVSAVCLGVARRQDLHRTTLRHEDLPFSSAHQLWLHGMQSEKSESLPDGFVGSEEAGRHLEQGPVVSADFSDT